MATCCRDRRSGTRCVSSWRLLLRCRHRRAERVTGERLDRQVAHDGQSVERAAEWLDPVGEAADRLRQGGGGDALCKGEVRDPAQRAVMRDAAIGAIGELVMEHAVKI